MVIMKKFEILNYQNLKQRHKVGRTVRKMAPIDLFNTGLPQTSNLYKKCRSAKCRNTKHNKMRNAYIVYSRGIIITYSWTLCISFNPHNYYMNEYKRTYFLDKETYETSERHATRK